MGEGLGKLFEDPSRVVDLLVPRSALGYCWIRVMVETVSQKML